MLSTVVLPAPLGPITLVTLPGGAVKVTADAALMPPKLMPTSCTASSTGGPCGARNAATSNGASTPAGCSFHRQKRASVPSTPSGATHRITSSDAPKNSSRYSASADRSSGSTTLTTAPTTGPKVQPAPPTT